MSIKSEPFELDNTKRVCVIRGPTTDNLDHAESLINELLRDRETIEKSIALNTSDDVGRVIGSGYELISVHFSEMINLQMRGFLRANFCEFQPIFGQFRKLHFSKFSKFAHSLT